MAGTCVSGELWAACARPASKQARSPAYQHRRSKAHLVREHGAMDAKCGVRVEVGILDALGGVLCRRLALVCRVGTWPTRGRGTGGNLRRQTRMHAVVLVCRTPAVPCCLQPSVEKTLCHGKETGRLCGSAVQGSRVGTFTAGSGPRPAALPRRPFTC